MLKSETQRLNYPFKCANFKSWSRLQKESKKGKKKDALKVFMCVCLCVCVLEHDASTLDKKKKE